MEESTELDTKRIQSLTDATFAVAMTVTILEINVSIGLNHSDLIKFILHEIFPSLFIYFLSFIVLGAFWVDSHFHHQLLLKTDRRSSWLNIISLMFVCIIPFSAGLLIRYRHDKLSAIFYCINLLAVSLCHFNMLIHTYKKGYIKHHITSAIFKNMKIRILVPILSYCVLIPLAFFVSEWIKFLFIAPLLFQIFFGRSIKEFKVKKS